MRIRTSDTATFTVPVERNHLPSQISQHDTDYLPIVRPDYRLDLDGLRGVAIALVVAFHVWMGRVSGGVDVFLVLSGFFFTAMVLRHTEATGKAGTLRALRRTGRRLLPALLVVLGAITVATVVLRPYTQWEDIGRQIIASMIYGQNWYLATAELDYLAPDPSVSPLQHLWSMAVQGQFYLVILAVVAVWSLVRRLIRSPRANRVLLLIPLLAGAVASFAYATIGAGQHQSWTYYDSGARAWELLVGAGIAVIAPWIRVPKWARAIAATAGLAMVLSCGVLFDGAREFPGPAALYPVLATVLLILSGMGLPATHRPWANRVLAGRLCTELGTLAYPFYLWHWPILIFYLAESGRVHAGLGDGMVVIGVSLLLAVITAQLVETPLRRHAGIGTTPVLSTAIYRRVVGVFVGAVGVAVLVATVGWQIVVGPAATPEPAVVASPSYPGAGALTSGMIPLPEPLRPSLFQGFADAPPPTQDGCIVPDTEVKRCVYGNPAGERTIAVVGGSHSEHWIPALEVLAQQQGFRIVTYLKQGCALTLVDQPSYSETPDPECRRWSTEVIDQLALEQPDWVFTISTRFRPYSDGDEVPPEFPEVWAALADRGLKILALRDTPRLRRDGVFYKAVDCLAYHGNYDSCGMNRSIALDPIDPTGAAAASYPSVFPLDLSNAVCRPERCRVSEGNILIYRDEHHLTASYSRSLAPELGRQIGAITQWW
ncbi:acyltransferase family protein [Nocardia sp. NPDC003693]